MSLAQKIFLTMMIITLGFSFILFIACKGSQIEEDKESLRMFSRMLAYNVFIFVFSAIGFLIGYIW